MNVSHTQCNHLSQDPQSKTSIGTVVYNIMVTVVGTTQTNGNHDHKSNVYTQLLRGPCASIHDAETFKI